MNAPRTFDSSAGTAVLAFPTARSRHAEQLRQDLERALEAALDIVDGLVARLDALDDQDGLEDDGVAEPSLAALVNDGSQIRWAGFERGPA